MEIKNGLILDERYVIIEKIAAGGMADVFEAHDQFLNRQVAIKIISESLSQQKESIRLFNQEYESITKLRDPAIVDVYSRFRFEGRECIVLELVKGYTLKDHIITYGTSTINEIAYFFNSISKGIAAAHKAGIIHRDIKPENILLSNDGTIKVADFGVCILEHAENNENKSIKGTSKYMSPEIIQAQSPSKKSDIYALGITLYEMATGTTPFIDDTATRIAIKHVKERVLEPSLLNPKINKDLEYVIMRALSKDPRQRYNRVELMNRDIQKIIQNKSIRKHYLSNVILLRKKTRKGDKMVYSKHKDINLAKPYWYNIYLLGACCLFLLIVILLSVLIRVFA